MSYRWDTICNRWTDGQCDFNMAPEVPSGAKKTRASEQGLTYTPASVTALYIK